LILPRDAGKMELDFAQRCGKNREWFSHFPYCINSIDFGHHRKHKHHELIFSQYGNEYLFFIEINCLPSRKPFFHTGFDFLLLPTLFFTDSTHSGATFWHITCIGYIRRNFWLALCHIAKKCLLQKINPKWHNRKGNCLSIGDAYKCKCAENKWSLIIF
jgi:hypothetical protein